MLIGSIEKSTLTLIFLPEITPALRAKIFGLNATRPYLISADEACYHFAHHPTAKPDVRALEQSMGAVRFELLGWRCLTCAYGVVSHRDIDYFIARRVIRQGILREAGRTQLLDFVLSVIRCAPQDKLLTHSRVAAWVDRSAIHIRDSNDWWRPCPSCGSDNTAVYRWLLVDEGGYRFVPSHDNLPLRTGAA